MKELYLIGFILTYVAFFVKQEKSLDKIHIESLKVTKYVLYGALLLPLLLVSSNGIEHTLKIMSVICGLISLKNIIQAEKPIIQEYIHPITISSILVSIYNQPILKENVLFVYLYYIGTILVSTSNDVTTLSKITYESALAHLLFFFTK